MVSSAELGAFPLPSKLRSRGRDTPGPPGPISGRAGPCCPPHGMPALDRLFPGAAHVYSSFWTRSGLSWLRLPTEPG